MMTWPVLSWIAPALMSLAVAALIAMAVVRARASASTAQDAEQDLGIYRKQLDEVEADRARGTIPEDEAERLRTEIARRLIAADARVKAAKAAQEPTRLRPALVVALVAMLVAVPLALYARIGAPGYGDLALKDRLEMAKERRETRPDQAEAEAQAATLPMPPQDAPPPDFEALIEKLRVAVLERPTDLQGQMLLARNEAALGNFKAAYAAQEQVLSIKGAEATAEDYLTYADLLILAAGGYVSPAAENALRAALTRDDQNGAARYYLGLMMRQNDRPDVAFRLWDQLLRQGPEDAPWIPPIRAQIDEAAMLAGVDYEQPRPSESLAGPSAEDIANAGEMSTEDRNEMIRGMVSRLSDRLATQGGSPAEWARLIGAYGVLGDVARARAIAAEARQVFAAVPEALDQIAAAEAGLPDAAPATDAPAAAQPAPTQPGPEQTGPEQDITADPAPGQDQ
ncbi:c-type cytochrome biogenesis protein CcmI [Pseudooceanicola sp. MF1-13]|uniref:c-type cytochrome biogenesis protein CcmI n=1 Tax=Pseudooceanicola sp. MF1-13 TaxID=3379095 RepID=UPI003891DEA7